jgi:hypothetical protein
MYDHIVPLESLRCSESSLPHHLLTLAGETVLIGLPRAGLESFLFSIPLIHD